MSSNGTLMTIIQEDCIQTGNYPCRVTHVIDRDFDLLRARVWERSAWIMHLHRVRDTVTTAMAILLGVVAGWMMMR
jgi:hypothetical protein